MCWNSGCCSLAILARLDGQDAAGVHSMTVAACQHVTVMLQLISTTTKLKREDQEKARQEVAAGPLQEKFALLDKLVVRGTGTASLQH